MENILEKESVQRVKKILNEFDKDLKIEILDNTQQEQQMMLLHL